jgi:hypothetical protein
MPMTLVLPTCLGPYFKGQMTREVGLEEDHPRRFRWYCAVLTWLADNYGKDYAFKEMGTVEYEPTDSHDLHLACPEEEGKYHAVSHFRFDIKREFIPPLTRLPLP